MTEAERAQKQSRLEQLYTEQHFRPASNTEEKLKEYAILNNELHHIPIPKRFQDKQEAEVTHSPLPWFQDGPVIRASAFGGEARANTALASAFGGEARANTALVVKSVNAYPRLVVALKDVRNFGCEGSDWQPIDDLLRELGELP